MCQEIVDCAPLQFIIPHFTNIEGLNSPHLCSQFVYHLQTQLPTVFIHLHRLLQYRPSCCKKNFTLEQAMKAHRGAEVYLYSFFNLGARWGWMVNAMPLPLYPSGKTRYSMYRRLGTPLGRSGRVRKISPPTGIRSPDCPAHSESLYRLSYPGSSCCKLITKVFDWMHFSF